MWNLPGHEVKPVSPALAGRLYPLCPQGSLKWLFFKVVEFEVLFNFFLLFFFFAFNSKKIDDD